MFVRSGFFIFVLMAAIAPVTVFAQDDSSAFGGNTSAIVPGNSPNISGFGPGFEIPVQGEHVVLDNVLLSPDNHLVFQADNLDELPTHINFYDAQTDHWLNPAMLTKDSDVTAMRDRLKSQGYVELPHMPMILLPNGTKVYNYIHVSDICFRPYADYFTETPPDLLPVERAFFLLMPQPQTVQASTGGETEPAKIINTHSCKESNGSSPALTRRYGQESAFYVPDGGGGFFALVSRYAIHFGPDGNTSFFKGRTEPVFLSPDETTEIRRMLKEPESALSLQDMVTKVEAIIDSASQAQANAK